MSEGSRAARRLRPDDLERVVAIDGKFSGQPRRGYFEKRLAAALRDPEHHLQFGVDGDDDDGLVAYVMARVLAGEFGRAQESVLLEVIGVDPAHAGHGLGGYLVEVLEAEMRARGIAVLETSIRWSDAALVRFFAALGFAKAPRHVVACPVSQADVL